MRYGLCPRPNTDDSAFPPATARFERVLHVPRGLMKIWHVSHVLITMRYGVYVRLRVLANATVTIVSFVARLWPRYSNKAPSNSWISVFFFSNLYSFLNFAFITYRYFQPYCAYMKRIRCWESCFIVWLIRIFVLWNTVEIFRSLTILVCLLTFIYLTNEACDFCHEQMIGYELAIW